MLSSKDIAAVVAEAASATLPKRSFIRAFTNPTTDSEGNDALIVTLVVRNLADRSISGDDALDTILRVRQDLEKAGEERAMSVEFATEADVGNGDA